MSFRSSTYSAVAQKVIGLRNLRKVKLFPTVGSVTIITYYKHQGEEADYIGRAHLITFTKFRIMNIALAHTSHLPPPVEASEEEELEEIELDTEPYPALGCHYLSPWQPHTLTRT